LHGFRLVFDFWLSPFSFLWKIISSAMNEANPAPENFSRPSTRRSFLKQTALAAAASPLLGTLTPPAKADPAGSPPKRPNVLLIISDQYRWDFICGYGRNPMDFTPNLDAMLRRGTAFENAFTNQPSPAFSPANMRPPAAFGSSPDQPSVCARTRSPWRRFWARPVTAPITSANGIWRR
jgi:hypothetical protein